MHDLSVMVVSCSICQFICCDIVAVSQDLNLHYQFQQHTTMTKLCVC